MNEEDGKALIGLKHLVADLDFRGGIIDARVALRAVALIERLTADNASLQAQNRRLRKVGQWYAEKHSKARFEARRLTAEVERLTPKPMTLKEACDVLNERKLRGRAWYGSTSESNISDLHNELVLKPKEAVYIAQGLLRDAGPTSTRTEAG